MKTNFKIILVFVFNWNGIQKTIKAQVSKVVDQATQKNRMAIFY
jgi:hypothetical protein